MNKIKEINIVGAGISGLTLGYFLTRYGFKINYYEKSKRTGGMISTSQKAQGLVETAANGCLHSPLIEELFRTINIPFSPAKKASKKRYIYSNSQFSRWPLNLRESIKFFIGIMKTLMKKGAPTSNQSVAVWAEKQFGESASKKLISPALQGIYANDGNHLSANLLFGRFFHSKKRTKAKGLIAPTKGMGSLVEGLTEYLNQNNGHFHFQKTHHDMPKSIPMVFAGSLESAKEFKPDLFHNTTLSVVDISSVTIFTNEKAPALNGFGALFPREENIEVLGILVNENIFEDRVNLGQSYTFIYRDKINFTDQELISLIKNDFSKAFKQKIHISEYQITHWPKSLPVYNQNLDQFLQEAPLNSKNLYFTGNYLGKLGLTGIVEYNKKLAETINQDFEHV